MKFKMSFKNLNLLNLKISNLKLCNIHFSGGDWGDVVLLFFLCSLFAHNPMTSTALGYWITVQLEQSIA